VRETRYVSLREFVNQVISSSSRTPREAMTACLLPDARYFRGVWLFSHKNVMIDGTSLL
jgi:hypothetical protein